MANSVGTIGWINEQLVKAKEDGFDNLRDWNNFRRERKLYKELEEKYGKEFAEWAKKNRKKVPDKYLKLGCKNNTEYANKCSQNRGYKDDAERQREFRHDTGRQLPMCESKDSNWSVYFGNFIVENYIIKTFEYPVKMPPNNPGFDWICKKGQKIQCKARCLKYDGKWSGWHFTINFNKMADYFILSAWDSKDSLVPLHVWIFHKDDIVRGIKFWRRETFSISNTPEKLKEFEKYEVTDRLEKLKELCNRRKMEKETII